MSNDNERRLDVAQEVLDQMLAYSMSMSGKSARPGRIVAAIKRRAETVRTYLDSLRKPTDAEILRADNIRRDMDVIMDELRPTPRTRKRDNASAMYMAGQQPNVDAVTVSRLTVLEQQVDALGKIVTQQQQVIVLLSRRSVTPAVAGAWARVMSGLPQSGDHQAVYDWLRAIRESGEDRSDVYKEALSNGHR